MQNNTRTNQFGIDLSDISPFPTDTIYVHRVIDRLQATKQNLSTKDLIRLFLDELGTDSTKLVDGRLDAYLAAGISGRRGLFMEGDRWDLYEIIKDYLCAEQYPDAYCMNILILHADMPSKSTLNPKKLAVWRNTSKMGSIATRQVVSVRRWIGSTLVGLDGKQQEALANKIAQYLSGDLLDQLDVRFASSADFYMWRDAYESDKIRSCMAPTSDCEVGKERTYTTYCTQHHGLPDNGLELAVLYQNDTPVARAITFRDGGGKFFVASYGDDRLLKWLKANDYHQADGYLDGTTLWAGEELMKPYVDGDVTVADRYYHYGSEQYYWVLRCYGGEYDLRTTDAYATVSEQCDLCEERHSPSAIYHVISQVNHLEYCVCECCNDDNVWHVYTGGAYAEPLFFHNGLSPTTNDGYIMHDGNCYAIDSLEAYDLVFVDGEVYHTDDTYQCDITEDYFVARSDVYTNAYDISEDQPVYFPYECISRAYWNHNVVECVCGTLALYEDVRYFTSALLGKKVAVLDAHYSYDIRYNHAGHRIVMYRLRIDTITEYCNALDDKGKAQQYLQFCRDYERVQALKAQELGI